jgi:hypothetical protein
MTLPIVPQLQEDPLWCWAAVASMVSVFYASQRAAGVALGQCDVASRTLARPCCPSPPPPAICHVQQNLQRALAFSGHLNNRVEASTNIAVVATEIQAGRPLCFAFQYNFGALHYLLIAGVNPGIQSVSVIDPATGVLSTGSYPNLLRNNAGMWAGWIFTV